MAQITYRALDSAGEPQYGQGQANFLSDTDAVGQAIETRLLLFMGEWWENKLDGTPWWQQMLGVGGAGKNGVVDLALQSRILGTPFVSSLENVQSSFNPDDRSFRYNASAQTSFGTSVAVNIPVPQDQRLPK